MRHGAMTLDDYEKEAKIRIYGGYQRKLKWMFQEYTGGCFQAFTSDGLWKREQFDLLRLHAETLRDTCCLLRHTRCLPGVC